MPWTPFPSTGGSFDVVVVHNREGQLASLLERGSARSLAECRRVLRPGGRIVVIDKGTPSGLTAIFQSTNGSEARRRRRRNAGGGRVPGRSDAGRPRRLSFRRRTQGRSDDARASGDLLKGQACCANWRSFSQFRPESRTDWRQGICLAHALRPCCPSSTFSPHDEIARAAGVPRAAVQRLVDTGALKPVAGPTSSTPAPQSRRASGPARGSRLPQLTASTLHRRNIARGDRAFRPWRRRCFTARCSPFWSGQPRERSRWPPRHPGPPGLSGGPGPGRWRRGRRTGADEPPSTASRGRNPQRPIASRPSPNHFLREPHLAGGAGGRR